jgi:hypothetical protein
MQLDEISNISHLALLEWCRIIHPPSTAARSSSSASNSAEQGSKSPASALKSSSKAMVGGGGAEKSAAAVQSSAVFDFIFKRGLSAFQGNRCWAPVHHILHHKGIESLFQCIELVLKYSCLTFEFVLEYPCGLNIFCTKIPLLTLILYWNIPAGIDFVLKCPY